MTYDTCDEDVFLVFDVLAFNTPHDANALNFRWPTIELVFFSCKFENKQYISWPLSSSKYSNLTWQRITNIKHLCLADNEYKMFKLD